MTLANITKDQIRAQFAKNAKQLAKMEEKAIATGKNVNGFAAEHLRELRLKAERGANA